MTNDNLNNKINSLADMVKELKSNYSLSEEQEKKINQHFKNKNYFEEEIDILEKNKKALKNKKVISKFVKLLRYNPDPGFSDTNLDNKVSKYVLQHINDEKLKKWLIENKIFNAACLSYKNFIWEFLFKFSDGYEFVCEISKYLNSDNELKFEEASFLAIEKAFHYHYRDCFLLKINKETNHILKIDDLIDF